MATEKKQKRILSPFEQQQLKSDKSFLRGSMDSPHTSMKEDVRKAMDRTVRHEQAAAPPELNTAQQDYAKREIARLETEISDGLLSSEEMRRGPHGAVAQNLRWHRKNAAKVERWRNLQKTLYAGMDKHDLSVRLDVDRLRPRVSRMSMEGAAIPQKAMHSFPSEQFKANYGEIDFGEPEPDRSASEDLLADISEEALERLTRPEGEQSAQE